MVRIGLTGGIASGKSLVATRLAELGAVVIDADMLARDVVAPGTPGLAAVVRRFGPSVLAGEVLDRSALGRLVFADAAARADLEQIIHPAVRQRAAEQEAAAPAGAVVVHAIPLLVETGQADDFDLCVVVDCEPARQVARLHARDGLTAEEAETRLAAQASRAERLAAADVVLRNDGTVPELIAQVDALWSGLGPRGSGE